MSKDHSNKKVWFPTLNNPDFAPFEAGNPGNKGFNSVFGGHPDSDLATTTRNEIASGAMGQGGGSVPYNMYDNITGDAYDPRRYTWDGSAWVR